MMDFTKWSDSVSASDSYTASDPVMRSWLPHLKFSEPVDFVNIAAPTVYPDDQVIVCDGRTDLHLLQSILKNYGLCIPRPELFVAESEMDVLLGSQRVAGALSMNLPHAWEHHVGNWRDWVIGMKIIQPNGEIIKTGSLAVKNVAGFDIHRFMVGARGSLGVIAEVTLRVYPLKAITYALPKLLAPFDESKSISVYRSLASEWEEVKKDECLMIDHQNFTIWSQDPIHASADSGWSISNSPDWEPSWSELEKNLYKSAKQRLDPKDKFEQGAWGPI